MRRSRPERADLGPYRFVRRGGGVLAPPPLTGSPMTMIDGTPLFSRIEGDVGYLVLDHRPDPAPSLAYVEWWTPLAPVEGGVAGLFVLTGSDRPPTIHTDPINCAGLAAVLTAAERATLERSP